MSGLVNTSKIYSTVDEDLLGHSASILKKMLANYDDENVVKSMSIDKADAVLRMIDSANSLVKTLTGNRLKVLQLKNESEDRDRLVNILRNPNIRIENRETELSDDVVNSMEIEHNPGEMTQGIEQLKLELLNIENSGETDYD